MSHRKLVIEVEVNDRDEVVRMHLCEGLRRVEVGESDALVLESFVSNVTKILARKTSP